MTENRRQQRLRTVRGGKIVFNDGQSVLDCRVRDLSPAGARLIVTTIVGVPDSFVLQIPDRPKKLCRIVWRGLEELGVAFVD